MILLRLSFLTLLVFVFGCKKDNTEIPELGTCSAVTPTSGFTKINEESYRFESAGGAIMLMERTTGGALTLTFEYDPYPNFMMQWWGAVSAAPGFIYGAIHENLIGKHIKDRIGNSRSLIFPDGTKITCVSAGPNATITAISIYEGNKAHHFNVVCNTIEYSSTSDAIARALDEKQADGETSTFEITATGLDYFNIYDEVTPGNKIEERVDLGRLYLNNPTNVTDYYDDPRLGHT